MIYNNIQHNNVHSTIVMHRMVKNKIMEEGIHLMVSTVHTVAENQVKTKAFRIVTTVANMA